MIKNKNLLIISYHYPPDPCANPYPTESWARYLQEYGWNPIILTSGSTTGHGTERHGYPVYSIDHQDRFSGLLKLRRRFQSSSFIFKCLNFFLINFLLYPDEKSGWYRPAVQRGLKIIRKYKVKAILSIGAPWTDHMIANRLNLITGIPWIADYRDPWTQVTALGIRPKWIIYTAISRMLEKTVVGSASCCIHASDVWAAQLSRMLNKRVHSIPNGYDSKYHQNREQVKNSVFTISYVGTLHFLQRLETFLGGFESFVREYSVSPETCRIQFVGTGQPSIISIEYPMINKYCSFLPYMPKEEAIHHMINSHILLLFETRDTGWYPTKVFEYLASGNNILASPDNGGVISKLLKNTGCGVSLKTSEDVAGWLCRQYEKFQKKSDMKPAMNSLEIAKYDRKELTWRLNKILDTFLKDETTIGGSEIEYCPLA